jgi:hypothetical protein
VEPCNAVPQLLGLDTGRDPAVSEADGATVAVRRCPANIDRRALWPRAEEERLPVRFHYVALETASQERQRLIRDRAAVSAINAQSAELGFHPSYADAEAQTPAR